ncbi:hypothetical protein J7643_11415 [bacterium]|nr:hypothetical protein [bacterium]
MNPTDPTTDIDHLDDDDVLEIETINLVPDTPAEESTPDGESAPSEASPFTGAMAPDVLTAHVPAAIPTGELKPIDPSNDEPAQEADEQLNSLLHVFQEHVTKIAQLVHRIRAKELYRNLGHETFEAYIKSKELRMSRSFIYQLAKVGEVIENAGVDLDAQPAARDLQISKLAQISRLPDPETHRKVLETGRITLKNEDGFEEDVLLNDVPVKKLNAHINEALGIPPKIAPAYDPMPEPAFKGSGQVPGMQNAAAYQSVVAAERAPEAVMHAGGWMGMLDALAADLRVMGISDRRAAVEEIVRVCQATVSDAVPF